MRKLVALVALAALAALSSPLWAATRTVTLSVPGMDCAVCPITVKKALKSVAGVSRIDVDVDRRQARVTYDDARTDPAALSRATGDAGYPSTVLAAAAR